MPLCTAVAFAVCGRTLPFVASVDFGDFYCPHFAFCCPPPPRIVHPFFPAFCGLIDSPLCVCVCVCGSACDECQSERVCVCACVIQPASRHRLDTQCACVSTCQTLTIDRSDFADTFFFSRAPRRHRIGFLFIYTYLFFRLIGQRMRASSVRVRSLSATVRRVHRPCFRGSPPLCALHLLCIPL